jgi:predicted dehydrogenase
MNRIRWGLLSTAHINRRLIPAIRASERGELVAVASRSQDSADAYAAQWGIPRAFGSYQALLDSDAIDAVYISLPNHLHAEWTITALRSGKHVLCEKPFALSLAEVDSMIAAAEETGNALAEAFMYRHHPQMKAVGEWVQSGRLGDILSVRSIFDIVLPARDNIRFNPALGGGSLWDVGVYPLSFAQYVMGGPPQRVYGSQWLGETGVDEDFAGQMEYGDGRVAQIACSFHSPYYAMAEVVGTEGRLSLDKPFVFDHSPGPRQLLFHPAIGEAREITVPDQELYSGEVEDMHDAILGRAANYLTLAETRNHVRTVLALYESARTGQVVAM